MLTKLPTIHPHLGQMWYWIMKNGAWWPLCFPIKFQLHIFKLGLGIGMKSTVLLILGLWNGNEKQCSKPNLGMKWLKSIDKKFKMEIPANAWYIASVEVVTKYTRLMIECHVFKITIKLVHLSKISDIWRPNKYKKIHKLELQIIKCFEICLYLINPVCPKDKKKKNYHSL